jgi:hypothetical protein
VIDFDDPDNNDYLAVNQFTVVGPQGHNRRADIVIFLNGLPLGVIELKNPADENATIWSAFHQLQTYQTQIARQEEPEDRSPQIARPCCPTLNSRSGCSVDPWNRKESPS